jgi:hypothetical protein
MLSKAMAITTVDTHQTVKNLTAAGFTDAQAEALAYALREAQQIDVADLATKADITEVRRELADTKAELIKWVVGVAFAQMAAIRAMTRFLGGHP